jgi:uncharacterized protein (TIGR01244 family)
MKAAADKYPDDETRLFYGQMLLSTMPEGVVDPDIQPVVANILEEIYARKPTHPGVLHYLTHVYDDPVNAQKCLVAARAYAKSADAVPHAHHMPSHIFVRLGLWDEAAAANENAWRISEADVTHAGEHGGHRDFHALNYLQYAYIQMGRYRDARRLADTFQAEYNGTADKKTAPDTPLLQAKHVKGRTIFGLPDRVAYGYFDTLARYLIETGDWKAFADIPLVAPSRDFVAMKTELDTASAARRGDVAGARAAATKLVGLSKEPGQDPFVRLIITIQAKEAEAIAAHAAKDDDGAVRKMKEAIAIEDSIFALSQPPYPAIPANEILGTMLLEMNRPYDASVHFAETLKRTPGRPKAVYGIARAAQAMGDKATAKRRYGEFLALWKNADPDRPELIIAKEYMAKNPVQVVKAEVPGITNFSRLDDATVGFGGATEPSAMAWLKKEGFVSVINLRLANEKGVDINASRAAAQAVGVKFINLPFDVANPDPQLFRYLKAAFDDKANQPIYIYCASANRVGYIWMIKRALEDGWETDKALKEAEAIGLTHPDLKESGLQCRSNACWPFVVARSRSLMRTCSVGTCAAGSVTEASSRVTSGTNRYGIGAAPLRPHGLEQFTGAHPPVTYAMGDLFDARVNQVDALAGHDVDAAIANARSRRHEYHVAPVGQFLCHKRWSQRIVQFDQGSLNALLSRPSQVTGFKAENVPVKRQVLRQ